MSLKLLLKAIEDKDLKKVKQYALADVINKAEGSITGSEALLHSLVYCQKHPEIIIYLLDQGANANSCYYYSNNNALLNAVSHKVPIEVIRKLISKGASVNQMGMDGTPLHMACRNGYTEAAELLIQKNADVNAVKRESPGILNFTGLTAGPTPLHVAAENGHLACIKLIVESGRLQDINAKVVPDCKTRNGVYYGGDTCLHYALREKHLECAAYLREHGASDNIVNHYGQTPVEVQQQIYHF